MSAAETEKRPASKRSCLRLFARSVLLLFVLLLLAAAVIAVGGYLVYDHVTRPGTPGEMVSVTIPEGLTGKAVGELLADRGLVEHELFFRLAMRLDKSGRPIKHGYYELPAGLSPTEILNCLQEGSPWHIPPGGVPDELKVTVPEGLTIAQMAEQFNDPGAFKEAASDPALLARLGLAVPSLEGFLMPNTYYFAKKPDERAVVERMFGQFQQEYAKLVEEIPEAAGRDVLEVVTIASLIEEECRVEEERSVVAAVIYNRMEEGMPLELDSTLQYALGKYGERILYEDKETDSPYNTYKRKVLPPGPISNPGLACLRAALKPAEEEYLFFVSNADGKTHTFSTNLTEHARAVRRFRREIAVQRRELREDEPVGEHDESQ
ncbi:MAG TPA: endolytic transglycosylase MltG [Candidatus Hydrogenedentes bacterium]|nr:endolytic transglycosylase MltG [Candidatus Hydrogenedentota bacterium]HQH50879.1 endolytic transglycosylase MltG [Candidatus Hydrogenedentota bacterium]